MSVGAEAVRKGEVLVVLAVQVCKGFTAMTVLLVSFSSVAILAATMPLSDTPAVVPAYAVSIIHGLRELRSASMALYAEGNIIDPNNADIIVLVST